MADVDVVPDPVAPAPEPPSRGRLAGRMVPIAAAAAGLVIGAGGVGLAWGLSGSSAPAPTASPSASAPALFSLSGSMTLKQASFDTGPCAGTGGYSDIGSGTSVTVYDAAGQVIATGALQEGKRVGLYCEFGVFVGGVPEGAKFYQVEVSHRGKITMSAEDAEAGRFAASLG